MPTASRRRRVNIKVNPEHCIQFSRFFPAPKRASVAHTRVAVRPTRLMCSLEAEWAADNKKHLTRSCRGRVADVRTSARRVVANVLHAAICVHWQIMECIYPVQMELSLVRFYCDVNRDRPKLISAAYSRFRYNVYTNVSRGVCVCVHVTLTLSRAFAFRAHMKLRLAITLEALV